MIETHRGIRTTTERINELEPKTIINRFNQKSISLPRIDNEKRFAGYPGLSGTSPKISLMIPDCKYYVELFAGTAKVYQEYVKRRIRESKKRKLPGYTAILNDTSKFIRKWLQRELYPGILVTDFDFIDCIKKYDSKDTVFMIDQPWFKTFYDQGFSSFNRDSVKQYDIEILQQCKKMKGKFFITTRKENTRMLNSGFYCYLVKSEYVVMNRYPKVLLTTNVKLDLRKHKVERIR